MNAPDLSTELGSDDPERRRQAVRSLLALQEEGLADMIMGALGDSSWRVRKEAVAVAVELAESAALIGPLVQAISQGENVGLRNAALDVLEQLGPTAGRELLNALPTVPEHARKFVVEALGEAGGGQVVAELSRVSACGEPNLAAEAIEALARIGGADAELAIRARLSDDDPFLRMAALEGLNRLAARVPWEELKDLLDDRLVRRVALGALGRCGRPEALDPLLSALEEYSLHAVGAATSSLVLLLDGESELSELAAARLAILGDRARQSLRRLLASGADVDLRRAALQLLLMARDVPCLAAMLELAARETLQPAALRALSAWGRDAVGPLLDLQDTAEGGARAIALELASDLASLYEESRVPAERVRAGLREGLRNDDIAVKEAAARCMSHWAVGEDASQLIEIATDSLGTLGRAAGQALRGLVGRYPESLERALSNVSLSRSRSTVLVPVVAALGGPHVVDRLQGALSSESATTRRAAVQGLASIGGDRALDLVGLALADEDPEVQAVAAAALGSMRSEDGVARGVGSLMTSLASDSPSTRAAAARALGQTGHTHAADSLRPLVSSDQPVVAVAALEGLRGLRAPGIGDVLRQALKHSDREVVKGALRLVTEARREDGEDALMEALGHHAWDVRALAADLIAEHGVVTLMAVLHRHRTRETDEVVRERMDRALAALGSGTEEVP